MILWICIGIFAALLILGAPILLCLGLPPVIWLLQDGSIPNLVMGQKMYTAVDSFSLIAIPFFMLAGQVMERTGITEAIVDFANSVIGWVRGGLACTVELAGILMAGISGSSNADASALLDYGFANFRLCPLTSGETLPEVAVELGTLDSVTPVYDGGGAVLLRAKDAEGLSWSLDLPESLPAPVRAGDVLGKLTLSNSAGPVAEVPLLAGASSVRLSSPGIFIKLLSQLFCAE